MRVASYLLHYVGFQSCDLTVIKGETLAIFSHCLDYRNIWIWATNNNSAPLPKEVFTFSRLDPHKACLLELCLVSVVYMDYTLLLLICALFFLFSLFFFHSRYRLATNGGGRRGCHSRSYESNNRKSRTQHCKNKCGNQTLKLGKSWAQNLKVSKKEKKKVAASSYPACQLAVAVQSLQMPLKKRSTTNVTGAEILGEPIRFKPFSKFCKKKMKSGKKKHHTWHLTFYMFCL